MAWLRRLWNTLTPGRVQRDIDRELSFHLAEREDQLRADGLSAEQAERRARVQFGHLSVHAERTREVDVSIWLDALLRDLRYAVRSLVRTPGFTTTAVLTLALGIGANTAVFSAIDTVLLRPLPFPAGDRLMLLAQATERTGESYIAPVRLEDWHRLNVTFDAMTGYYMEDVSETSGEFPERVRRAWVAPRFLEVWGIAPAIGRGFADAEHRMGRQTAVLISDRYWRTRLGADPNVLGRTIRTGSAASPIIGVMPATFLFPDRGVDLWFPVSLDAGYAQSRLLTWYTGVGRLKRGVTLEQARANLAAVQARLADEFPDSDRRIAASVTPLKETAVSGVRRSLWLLFAGVSVLLLITCTNIAALLLARAAHRRHEISVRLSLGASHGRVAVQMLIEALVLSLAGAAIGLVAATAASAALRSAAADLPRMDEIAIDWRILLYALASAVFVALLCGIIPVLAAARNRAASALREGGRTEVSTRQAIQWMLVGAQVALSVALLADAGLLVRSFQELARVDAGFDARRILTFRVSGNYAETMDYDRLTGRIDSTIDALAGLPGVEAVATAMALPAVSTEFERTFVLAEAAGDQERQMVAERRIVSPEYFATLQIPLLEGEACRRRLRADAQTLLVNRAFARRYLSARPSPIGLHLTNNDQGSRPGRIVGVVADVREQGLDRPPVPAVYGCFSAPNPTPYFLVRTRGEPLDVAGAVRLKLKELEPVRSVFDIAPLDDRIDGAFAQNRLRTVLLVLVAATALALACVGLYGTLSYAVNTRRKEIGLRLALGAHRSGIVGRFLLQGLRVVALAAAAGLALAMASAQVLTGMLFGVSPHDPMILSSVVAIVLAVAALAALVPVSRAALVEPMQVLRDE